MTERYLKTLSCGGSGISQNADSIIIMIDDEERSIKLASMAASRVERILWSGFRIASVRVAFHFKSTSLICNIGIQVSCSLETTPQFGMADIPSLNIAERLCI